MKTVERKEIALVASGGAAKGFFHIGVLQGLREYGLRPDCYVGASSGAFITAFAAAGHSPEEMQQAFLSSAVPGRRGLPRLTRFHIFYFNPELLTRGPLGASGIFGTERLERYIRENIRVNDFRKLKRHLYVTATNLHTGNRVIFGKGHVEDVPISKAVAASMSLPPLFKPYVVDGVALVDGEFKKTFSMDIAFHHGARTIFASNVYVPYRTLSGRGKLHRSGMLNILRQSLYILMEEKIYMGIDIYRRDYPDVDIYMIESDNRDFLVEVFDLYRAKELIESGREKCLQVLSQAGFVQRRAPVKFSLIEGVA